MTAKVIGWILAAAGLLFFILSLSSRISHPWDVAGFLTQLSIAIGLGGAGGTLLAFERVRASHQNSMIVGWILLITGLSLGILGFAAFSWASVLVAACCFGGSAFVLKRTGGSLPKTAAASKVASPVKPSVQAIPRKEPGHTEGPKTKPSARPSEKAAPAKEPDYIEKLKQLAKLRDEGVLTQQEFEEKKAKILKDLA